MKVIGFVLGCRQLLNRARDFKLKDHFSVKTARVKDVIKSASVTLLTNHNDFLEYF